MCCYRNRLVFNCCFEETDISQGSVATHSRCGGIFSDSIITNVFLIQTVKISLKIGQYLTLSRTKMCQFLGHPVHVTSRHVARACERRGAAEFPAHRSAPFTGVMLTAPFPLQRFPAPAPLTLHLIFKPRSPLHSAHLTF